MNTDEIILDSFAGGGGASTGIELALGRSPDLAINHDAQAIAMHAANHPATQHHCESVWDVDPVEATRGRPVGLAWFSPDCKHFSKAKGGKPREKRIRGLAWIVLHWVNAVRPRVIMLENVEEFQTWGPLQADGHAHAHRRGWFFRCFIGALRRRGYIVEWRELRACDFGAPTIRKRLFLIARCDGLPVVWPEPTHGAPKSEGVQSGRLAAWRTAAECIDWSMQCPSIFTRQRPLAEATLRRIAKGIMRYVVEAAEPFVVRTAHGEQAPHITKFRTGSTGSDAREPVPTITAGPKENPAGAPHALGVVSAFLAKHYTGVVGVPLTGPAGTVTATDHHSLVSACLVPRYGERPTQEPRARDISTPAPTIVPTGNGGSLCTAQLVGVGGRAGQSRPRDASEPVQTITSKADAALVRAFLIKYYGSNQAPELRDPLHTVTSRDRFGLVTVAGEEYAIVDIGLRMLAPRELFRAQGFPESYIIGDDPARGLVLTKSAQVRMCGNSVCPPIACALVAANVPELARERAAA